jgi:hypothetical protein
MVANPNVASIGRFSSQMLTYLGTQKTVKNVTGSANNTFKYSNGTTVFPDPGSLQQSMPGAGVSGSYPLEWYNNVKSYFLGRGASQLYADTMTGMAIDVALSLGITPQSLLEQVDPSGKLLLTTNAYRSLNMLRDPSHQVGIVTAVDNRYSPKAREIRA